MMLFFGVHMVDGMLVDVFILFFFFQAEDGIRDLVRSRGLGDVYKRQRLVFAHICEASVFLMWPNIVIMSLPILNNHLRFSSLI